METNASRLREMATMKLNEFLAAKKPTVKDLLLVLDAFEGATVATSNEHLVALASEKTKFLDGISSRDIKSLQSYLQRVRCARLYADANHDWIESDVGRGSHLARVQKQLQKLLDGYTVNDAHFNRARQLRVSSSVLASTGCTTRWRCSKRTLVSSGRRRSDRRAAAKENPFARAGLRDRKGLSKTKSGRTATAYH